MVDVALIRESLGPLAMEREELARLCEALGKLPVAAVRLRQDLDAESLPFVSQPTPWHPHGFFVTDDSRPGSQIQYAAGDYYIQDAASLLAVTLLDAQPGERVCDLCAAPGGKATALLEAIGDDGWLLANETIRSRIAALRFNLARQGLSQFALAQQDPGDLADTLGAVFDAVLVDAPCTGQSLLGRGKQTGSAFNTRSIRHCAARQTRILDAASRLVRPGGRLAYSTCTFSYAENEGQLEAFLERYSGWQLDRRDALKDWESRGMLGCYRLWPHRDRCGGAFAAVLRRCDDDLPAEERLQRRRRGPLRSFSLPKEFREWGTLKRACVLGTRDRRIAWSESVWEPLAAVAVDGPEVAFLKGNTWFPSYALAMRRDGQWSPSTTVSLSDDEAREYLGGNTLACAYRGWAVATWRGRSLGWLKGDGKRAKNHLPKPARFTSK